jgi:hypothetical protein
MGGRELRAELTGSGWEWRERSRSGKNGDLLDGKGGFWTPLTMASKEQWVMVKAFEAGAMLARGAEGRFDPTTEAQFRDQALDAQIPQVRSTIDTLAKEAKSLDEWVHSAVRSFADSKAWLEPAFRSGVLEMKPEADGTVNLRLKRLPGMTDAEWRRLETAFGPKVAQYEKQLQSDQSWLGTRLSMRERSADQLVRKVFEPAYQRFLAGLPSHERLAEMTRIAQAVRGTSAATRLAETLFSERALKADASGILAPATDFSKLVLDGAWSSESGRLALSELALSLGSQLPRSGAQSLERVVEVMLGRELKPSERVLVSELHAVKSPQAFQALLKPDSNSPPSVLQKAGDLSDLLTELGTMSGAKKLGKATSPTVRAVADAFDGTPAQRLTTGAHFLALFQLYNSSKDLLEKGASVDTAASFAEDLTRAVGTWGAIAEVAGKGSGLAARVGRVAGPISDAIGLVNDIRREASTADGRYKKQLHVGASGLILAGGLAGGPVGVAGVLVGLGVKLLVNRNSESFEASYETLRRLFSAK